MINGRAANKADGSVDLELGAPPVSALGVVPDLVVRLVPEPVRQRPVLSLLLPQTTLLQQGLVRSHLRL